MNKDYSGWSEDYLIGHDELDAQHKDLLEHLTAFLAVIDETQETAALASDFRRLTEEVHKHFADEERVMIETGFSNFDRHKAEHNVLLVESEILTRRIESSEEPQASADAARFLWNLVVGHLTLTDIDLRAHFKRINEKDAP